MSSNNNQNPVALNLETLSKQYDAVLTEYTQTQTDYINYLSNNPTDSSFSSLQGHSYYGTKTIQTTTQSSVDNCVALCPTISGCSGGTFNSTNNSCQLVSGTGTINADTYTKYAIVKEDKIYLQKLQSLNKMLTNINAKILVLITSGQEEYQVQNEYRAVQTGVLQQNSQSLYHQRANIEQRLRELNEMNSEQDITATRTKSYYYSYVLFLFFVINSVFIVISFNVGENMGFAETFRRNLFLLILLEILFFFLFVQTAQPP